MVESMFTILDLGKNVLPILNNMPINVISHAAAAIKIKPLGMAFKKSICKASESLYVQAVYIPKEKTIDQYAGWYFT